MAITPDRLGDTTVFMASPHIESALLPRTELSAFVSLERCVPVRVGVSPSQEVWLKLLSHLFWLCSGDKLTLIDELGKESALPEGRALVGYASEKDIAVDATNRSVSRNDLVVDKASDYVYLTDFSSLGPFCRYDSRGAC